MCVILIKKKPPCGNFYVLEQIYGKKRLENLVMSGFISNFAAQKSNFPMSEL